MQDARVKSAAAHWGPRFVANGVALADFEEITGSITSWDEWCRAWSGRAAVHEQLGRDALAKRKFLSAGEHLSRAAVYYHFGKFLFVHDVPQMQAAHRKAVECKTLALPHMRPAGERVEIPYGGKKLYGILRKPNGVEKPPVMAMCCGLDSTKEETDAYEQPFLARGVATLCFDGPGQGEAEYDFAIRGDYEAAVKAVIDAIEARGDLETSKIGLWGVSLGGYYAPRSAAFDKRIKACIALCGPFDWAEGLGRTAGAHARRVPHAQPLRDHGRSQGACGHAFAEGRRRAHHLPAVRARRKTRSRDSLARRGAPRTRSERAGRAALDRGRQPRGEQSRLQVAHPDRRLDGGAAPDEAVRPPAPQIRVG